MSDDYGDKTEAPTLRRRQDAREQGNVARSNDLVAAAVLVSALVLLQGTGPRLVDALRKLVGAHLASAASPSIVLSELIAPALAVARAALPLLVGLVVVAILANLLQVGFLFRRRKSDALNVAKGWARLFSGKTIARLAGHVLKLAIVLLLAYTVTRGWVERIVSLQQYEPESALAAGGRVVFGIAVRIGIVLLVLGILDYAYQRWQHERSLRMTRREVTDELRQMEGSPLFKHRRRELSTTLAAARLERDVAAATVVVFDEPRAAVALRYEPAAMPAPIIVVKATGPLVARVRAIAAKHHVPTVEREPLARALSKLANVGQDVPQQLFADVAEVLAYASAIRRDRDAAAGGGGDA